MIKDMTKLDPLNGYQQQIYRYIKNYHPYILENREDAEDVIVMRAENASKAYKDASDSGASPYDCEQAAMQALHAGLEFSPITYLIEACMNSTGFEIGNDEACYIYRNPAVLEIFERYGTEIEGDPREEWLIAELEPYFAGYKGKGNMFFEGVM
jgi:PAS domain-containing protein